MILIAKHILVKGQVQGVFFRKNTKQVAEALNVDGWIKNTKEGNVEIFAQADKDAIEKLIAWCSQGPPRANVEDVEIKDAAIDKSINNFSIEY
jgi:acylphosphatase